MAEVDRQRLLARALELPQAAEEDFSGRKPPPDADPAMLKIIADTGLRSKLVEARIAEGLQSPKGPQKIASIVRIYPEFDAPGRLTNGRARVARPAAAPRAQPPRALPTIEEMERLIARLREVENHVSRELTSQVDERIAHLKHSFAHLPDEELEAAHRELGEALERRRGLAAQVRQAAFRHVEADNGFAPRIYLRLLAH
jgi:hypothetical protein